MAKPKEQKRREAYERIVASAQRHYRTLRSFTEAMRSNPDAVRPQHHDTQALLFAKALQSRDLVWYYHRKFRYALPDLSTFYNP